MSAHSRKADEFAKQLFRLSFDGPNLSEARIGAVLDYIERHRPANPVMVLKTYRRLVAGEIARHRAVVEHGGPVSESVLESIGSLLTQRYGRTVTAVSQPNPSLIAGLRVRVGDDIYESSIAGQLAGLATSV
jgi:F-type H+-transporting ATPase subunit delta